MVNLLFIEYANMKTSSANLARPVPLPSPKPVVAPAPVRVKMMSAAKTYLQLIFVFKAVQ